MTRKVLVGMLLLGALFIFGLATFYVENWEYMLGKGYRLHASFAVAQTLDRGDMVRLAGVPVGVVQDLAVSTEADTAQPVETVLWLKSGTVVRGDDRAVIKMSTLFGGNYVAIERGDPGARLLTDGETIRETDVAPSVTEVIEQSTETLSSISSAFDDFSGVIEELREGEGTLAHLLSDEELFAKLESIVDDTHEAADGLRTASDRLKEGEGVLGRLLMDDELAADLDAMTGDLKSVLADLADGQGTLPRLLKDEGLYEELESAIATITDAAEGFRDGEGILPRLLSDEAMAERLDALLSDAGDVAQNLRDVSAGLRDGEGSLGKLLADEELYEQLKLIAGGVQAMVDAYREQSPVMTLAGAVFGAF